MRLYEPILSDEALKEGISLSMFLSPCIVECNGCEVVHLGPPPRETTGGSCYRNCWSALASIEEKTRPHHGGRVMGVRDVDGNHSTHVRERRSYDGSGETMLRYQNSV